MEKYVITIARGYGSGGRAIGKMLAKELGINFYDREILRLASDDSGINEELFANLKEEDGRELLKSIKGVGDKVANCVLLFGLGYRNAFPIDVWIKRIMEAIYFGKETSKEEIQKFASNHYGEYGGYAQQYLFCFGRNGKIGTNTDKKKKSDNKK